MISLEGSSKPPLKISSPPTNPFIASFPLFLFVGLLAGILCAGGYFWALILPVLLGSLERKPLYWGAAALTLALGWGLGDRAQKPTVNPLEASYGKMVVLRGDWDGQFLHLSDPPLEVALSPKPLEGAGTLEVLGTLGNPPGQRNFGGFDYQKWLALQGVHSIVFGAKVRHFEAAMGFRSWFQRGLAAGLGPRSAALMQALELGDRAASSHLEISSDPRSSAPATTLSSQKDQATRATSYFKPPPPVLSIRDAFTRAGLAHLMALSGQHVAILVALLGAFLLPMGLWRYPVLLVFLAGYLGFVGVQPSIVRAVLQGAAVLFSLWVGRGRLEPLGALSLAGLLSLLVYPNWLFDLGFQLSYLAVLGLLIGHLLAQRFPSKLPKWLLEGLWMTLASSLTTLPLIAHTFGQIPWVALPANLVCGPFMIVLVPLGLLAGVLGPLSSLLNTLIIGPICTVLLWLVELFAQAEPIPWGNLEPAGFVLYGLWLLAGILWLLRGLKGLHFTAITLLALLSSTLAAKLSNPRAIDYLDIGQGDSSLIRVGQFSMLIDGGGTPRGDFDVGRQIVIPTLRSMGVFKLEVVVASHADSDHIEGLISVLERLPVGELWIGDPKTGQGDPVLDHLLEAAKTHNIPIRQVRRGDTFEVGGVRLEVMSPSEPTATHPFYSEDNPNSIVIRLTDGAFKTVFLGDKPSPLEETLGIGPLSILKTAHHGSRYSSDDAFLDQTQPKTAIISVGRNTYGHPNPLLLERLSKRKIAVLRTDQVGGIRLELP